MIKILINNFLEFQWGLFVKGKVIYSHAIFLTFLAYVWGALNHSVLYILLLFIIIILLSLSEIFPKSFGIHYINFLKKYSSPEIFSKFCGDSFIRLKECNYSSFTKNILVNGLSRALDTVCFVLILEHFLHNAKLGQRYKHLVKDFMNNETTQVIYEDNANPSFLDIFVSAFFS